MTHTIKAIITAASAMSLISMSQAAITLDAPYSNPGPDGQAFLYSSKLTATDASYATYSTNITPGGWSFADLRGTSHTMFGAPISGTGQGWGHSSRWVLLEITTATQFVLSMTPWNNPATGQNEATDARPGFVIYAGESINDAPGEAHTYSNDGSDMSLNDGWDLNGPGGTRGLTYVTNGYNALGGNLSKEISLAPGLYTIAMGNIGDSTLATGGKGFTVTFTVPEPSAALLSMAGALGLFLRRRRI